MKFRNMPLFVTENTAQPPITTPLPHPNYRADIDGLRAVAVISVVLFHAFPTLLAGGFIGVDVFFVISGYLISTIIFSGLEQHRFSFATFYARRVKRIFPALLLVLVASYGVGWCVLVADEYKQLGKHMAAGAGFLSNFVLWHEAGYFDNSAETKPLLHLWSLGIEEQFYIVWPVTVWLAWKRKWGALAAMALLAAGSLYWNVTGIRTDATATFYSPQTRFWELLAGSALAWATLYASALKHLQAGWLAQAFSLLGAALLAFGLSHIHKDLSFPGWWAVIPVSAAVMIIAAGPNVWFNRFVLSNRLAVWFGVISFPLYLWHWPLLSFARIIEGGYFNKHTRIDMVLVSVLLAWLTYRFIERPIRFGAPSKVKTPLLVVLMLCVGLVGYATYHQAGLAFRKAVSVNTSIGYSGDDGGDGNNFANDCALEQDVKSLFAYCGADKRGHVKYALLGDSKAGALYAGLIRTSTDKGRWMFIGGNNGNGAPIPVISSAPELAKFQTMTTAAVNEIAKHDEVETVVLVTAIRSLFKFGEDAPSAHQKVYDYSYLGDLNRTKNYDRTLQGLRETFSRFVKSGKNVVLVVDNPPLPEARDCTGRKTSLDVVNAHLHAAKTKPNPDCYLPLATFQNQTAIYRKLLDELKHDYPSAVTIFDATDIYCANGTCGPTRDGRLLYAYTDHISDYAAGLVGARLNALLSK